MDLSRKTKKKKFQKLYTSKELRKKPFVDLWSKNLFEWIQNLIRLYLLSPSTALIPGQKRLKFFYLVGQLTRISVRASWANMSGYATHKLYFSQRAELSRYFVTSAGHRQAELITQS